MNDEAVKRILDCLANADKEVRQIPTVFTSHSPKLRALVEIEEARQIILKEMSHGKESDNGPRTSGA